MPCISQFPRGGSIPGLVDLRIALTSLLTPYPWLLTAIREDLGCNDSANVILRVSEPVEIW